MLMGRVEIIKQSLISQPELPGHPTPDEAHQLSAIHLIMFFVNIFVDHLCHRQLIFDHLFQTLLPNLLYLFPSTRLAVTTESLPPIESMPDLHPDALDQAVWQFLGALAEQSSSEQQQALVTVLREKILDNITSLREGWFANEDERLAKVNNVNMFLHPLGLDISQVNV